MRQGGTISALLRIVLNDMQQGKL